MKLAILVITLSGLAAASAAISAATLETPRSAPPAVLDVWPGVAPGSDNWRQHEASGSVGPTPIVRNITHPTLTVFLPDPAHATGTGVIVAPGGGFMFLSIENEGVDVARALTSRGIAAFVLKYRTRETPADPPAFLTSLSTMTAPPGSDNGTPQTDPSVYAVADAVQALTVVRAHAQQWGLDPRRVGIVGFSAGARVAVGALLQDKAEARPSFAAPIYGGLFGTKADLPHDLPPVFAAVSTDDPISQSAVDLFVALRASGAHSEFHVFNSGGHGFGMAHQGKTSDHWFDEFYWWMNDNGLLRAGPANTAAPKQFTTADTPLGDLLDNPAAKVVLQRHVPELVSSPQIELARGLTLKGIQVYSPTLTDAVLATIDRDLAALSAQ
jgi:acetyl esterase/lipase